MSADEKAPDKVDRIYHISYLICFGWCFLRATPISIRNAHFLSEMPFSISYLFLIFCSFSNINILYKGAKTWIKKQNSYFQEIK